MMGVLQFPLVNRELVQAGRNMHTYLGRSYLAIIAMIVIGLVWFGNDRFDLRLLENKPEFIARFFAGLALFFQYAVVILAAPGMAVPLIIREKEERTLPLLLLTGRRHWDVIAAKYVSVLVQVGMLVLAVLPLQAIAAIFGGVNIAGVALQTALMLLVASAVCAIALYFSAICKTTTAAIPLVYFSLILWVNMTFFLDRYSIFAGAGYQTNVFTAIPSVAFSGQLSSAYYPALALTGLIAACCLFRAATVLPRQVLRVPVARTGTRRSRFRGIGGSGLRGLIIGGADGLGMSDRSTFVRALAFVGLCCIARAPVVGWLMIVVIYLWATTRGFGRLRASGALEEILLTPQSDRTVVSALVTSAITRSGFFLVPLALTLVELPLPVPFRNGLLALYSESPLEFSLWIVVLLLQFPLCAAIAGYVLTISRPLRSLERYANLVYILGVIFPFLLPYLTIAILATMRRQIYSPDSLLMQPSVALSWAVTVSMVAGLLAYFGAIRRIRIKIAAGHPSTRENPLFALLRP